MPSFADIEGPAGAILRVTGGDSGVTEIAFSPPPAEPGPSHPVCDEAVRQLRAYFEGKLWRFDLPLDPRGTAFQLNVWRALIDIPYGETRSYREVAREIGAPQAVRAVGAANGANPIAVVVPCHRVIGSGGKLTGYGGGLPVKKLLLELEARYAWKSREAAV